MAEQIEENPGRWAEKCAALIKRNSAGLLELVNQILDLRKLESGRLQLHPVQADIIHHLRYTCESFHSLAESKQIDLQFNASLQKFIFDFDPEKMTRVFSNLLSNAIKFTDKGGTVQVEVQRIKVEDTSPVPGGSTTLMIRVKDTGRGIPADQLPFIFDRFHQIDDSSTRREGGAGIGLALVAELIQLMQAEIKVESEVGQGTAFSILLPVHQEAEVLEMPPATTEISEAKENFKEKIAINIPSSTAGDPLLTQTQPSVLIIDDHPDIIEYLQACLEDRYELLIARDGAEGIEIALHLIPDLIISDVMMPGKDGYEVCHTLKTDERTSHIPIILLTAKADQDSKLEGLKQGADAYLAKPFNKQELFIRLENLHQLRLQLQARYRSLAPPPPSPDQSLSEDMFIQKLRSLIESKLDDPDLNIQKVSKELFMSRVHLYRKVSALTGQSPSVFIRRIRLHKAKELLEKGKLNVTQIAYEVGFSNPSYFTTSFKEEFGAVPRHFIKS